MINDFADNSTAAVFAGKFVKGLPRDIQIKGRLKLRLIDGADDLQDLRSPPGNRLELLHGDREGQHSIRINDQWRVCFVWQDGNAYEVEIVDYHR